jgi:hypothetical protein
MKRLMLVAVLCGGLVVPLVGYAAQQGGGLAFEAPLLKLRNTVVNVICPTIGVFGMLGALGWLAFGREGVSATMVTVVIGVAGLGLLAPLLNGWFGGTYAEGAGWAGAVPRPGGATQPVIEWLSALSLLGHGWLMRHIEQQASAHGH